MRSLCKVAWSCKEEWDCCKNNLFSSDLKKKQNALKHLYIWKMRNGSLPIAVECTLILMEVYLKEIEWRNESNDHVTTTTMSFESWYSMAIMRFLNLVMDANIKIKASGSMTKLAQQIDIPQWIVNIRHAAAHGHTLPSLSLLKEAVDFCLKWLYDNYWDKPSICDAEPSEESDQLSFTHRCFLVCQILKERILNGFSTMSDLNENDRELVCNIFSRMKKNMSHDAVETWNLNAICEIAFKRLSRHLTKNVKNSEDLVDHILNSNQSFLTKSVRNYKIPKNVLHQWTDILSAICNSSGCPYLLKRLSSIFASDVEELWRRECAASYANEIFKNIFIYRQENSNFGKKETKRKRGVSVPSINITSIISDNEITELIGIITENSNVYSYAIVKNLIHFSEGSELSLTCKKLLQLIAVYNGEQNSELQPCNEFKIHTLQDLIGSTNVSPAAELSSSEAGCANRDTSVWNKMPLGVLPWQTEFRFWSQIYENEETINVTK